MFFCLASVEIDGRSLLVHSCAANNSSSMQVLMNVLVKGFTSADDLIAAIFLEITVTHAGVTQKNRRNLGDRRLWVRSTARTERSSPDKPKKESDDTSSLDLE